MTSSKSEEEWPQELDWGANWQGRYKWCPWKGPGADGGDGQSHSNRQNACRDRRIQSRAKIPELELQKWELEQEVARLGKSVKDLEAQLEQQTQESTLCQAQVSQSQAKALQARAQADQMGKWAQQVEAAQRMAEDNLLKSRQAVRGLEVKLFEALDRVSKLEKDKNQLQEP